MATYYWVGGTGTWNNTSTLNWSNTSGGANGFGPPTSSDTVIFDNGSAPGSISWTVTVASTATSASTTIQESNATSRFYFTLSLSGSPTLTTSGPLTFNYGIINLNNNTLTIHSFVSTHTPSSIEQRDLDFGSSGKIVCTAYSGTVFNNNTSYLSVLPLSGGDRRVEVYVPSTSQTTTFTNTGSSHVSLYLVNGVSSGSGTLQATSPAQLRNLSIPNNSFTFSYSIIDLCGSLTIGGTNPTLSSSGGSFYFNFTDDLPSSNGDIFDINTNGKTIPSTFNFNHLGRTCRLLNNIVTTVSNNLSSGGLNLNGYTFQSKSFNSSGSGVRSLQFGSGGKLTLIGDPTVNFTIFDARTTTNFTVVDSTNSLVELSVPNSPRTSSVYPSTTDNALLNFRTIASSGGLNSGIVYFRSGTAGANVYIRDLVLYNAAYVLQTNNNLNIKGSLDVLGNSVNLSSVSTTYTVTIGTTDPSAANNTISIGTQVLDFNIKTIGNNSLSRGVVLNSNVTQSANRTFTLESGRLDLNNYTLTTNTFSSSNSNNRNVDFKTSGSIVLQDNAFISTPISINDSTNLSVYGSGGFKLQVGNPFSGKTITGGTSGVTSYLNTFNLELIAAVGTNGGSMNVSGNFRSLVLYDGPYTFTMTSSKTLWGSFTLPNTNANLILGSSISNNITFKNSVGSGADNTVTTNSFTIPFPIVIDNFESSGLRSFKFGSNFVSTSSITLTSGILDTGVYDVTIPSFASNNSNVRTLNLGSGTWTINGNGTVWNILNGTNLTLNKQTATIVLNNAFSSSFYGGSKSYGSVVLDGASVQTIIYGSNTFDSLSNLRTVSQTLQFEAGSLNTFASFTVTGTSPSVVVALTSATSAIFYMVKTGGGTVNLDYMDISYSYVSPPATWVAGANSVNSGNNNGWVGFAPPFPPSNGFMAFF